MKENITLECMLFLNQCLRHQEEERKNISELVKHPYIVRPHDQQTKLDEKQLEFIFDNKDEPRGRKNQRRPMSQQHRLVGGIEKHAQPQEACEHEDNEEKKISL